MQKSKLNYQPVQIRKEAMQLLEKECERQKREGLFTSKSRLVSEAIYKAYR